MDEIKLTAKLVPGVPSMTGLQVDGNYTPYPDSTQDFAKVMRLHGFEVEYVVPPADRRIVGFRAAEVWLPLIEFGYQVLVATQAGILTELLKDYVFGGREHEEAVEPSILHVEWSVERASGDVARFSADGRAGAVLESLDRFERSLRDD